MATASKERSFIQSLLGLQNDVLGRKKILTGGSLIAFGIVAVGWYKKQQQLKEARKKAQSAPVSPSPLMILSFFEMIRCDEDLC